MRSGRLVFKKYKLEIKITVVISIITTLIGSIVSVILAKAFDEFSLKILILTFTAIIIISLLLSILFNLQNILSKMFSNLQSVVTAHSESIFQRNKYREREDHFRKEKILLAKTLVTKCIPDLFEIIINKNKSLEKINLFIDSGTTITPVFRELMSSDIKMTLKDHNIELKIYTNNLQGINELFKYEKKIKGLDERDFNLISGKPLSAYMATTGELTMKFLEARWREQKESNTNSCKTISIALITSNWFLNGIGLNKISLCAKGEGHLDFKKNLIENCDFRLIISPLGKILPLDDVHELEKFIPKDDEGDNHYNKYTIESVKKENTYLLTSFRKNKLYTPLFNHSLNFVHLSQNKHLIDNFIISKHCPYFTPEGDNYDILVSELPHRYIRENFESIFHQKLNL